LGGKEAGKKHARGRGAHHAAAPRGRGGEGGGGRGERGVVAYGRPEALEHEVAAVHRPGLSMRGLRVRGAGAAAEGGGHRHRRRARASASRRRTAPGPGGEPPAEQEHEQPRGVDEREEQRGGRGAPPRHAAATARAPPRGGLARRGRTRTREGHPSAAAGLGLALAREVARAHGGEIEVEDAPGRGAEFCMWLSLESDVSREATLG